MTKTKLPSQSKCLQMLVTELREEKEQMLDKMELAGKRIQCMEDDITELKEALVTVCRAMRKI